MDKLSWQEDLDYQKEASQQVEKIQLQYLLQQANYCITNSPFYREKYAERGIDSIDSLDDFRQLDFTTKDDLQQSNEKFLAVREEEVVDTCFTSATVGTTPVNFFMTKSDLSRLTHNEKLAFEIAGVTKHDKVAACVAIERGFMAGLAYFLGGVELGCHMIRVGMSHPQHMWDILKTHRPSVIIGIPSVLARVAAHALKEGDDPQKIGVKKILAIGEPIRDKNLGLLESCAQIEDLWNAPLFSTYASTEMASTFCECEQRKGGHYRPELIYVEIVDDEGNPVPDGQSGEVVVTPLGVVGTPLIRFKTGDITYSVNEPCTCGRTSRRIGPVLGRKSQMLKYKGTTVFPNALVSIVEANPDFTGCYVEAHSGEFGEDLVKAFVAASRPDYDLDKLEKQFKAGIRVIPEIHVISEEEFFKKTQPPGKRKRSVFFNKRAEE